MFGQITELAKAQGVCDIKVIQISATHMKNIWRRGVVIITTAQLHSTKSELRFCANSIHKNISDASRRNFAINKEINTTKFTKKFNTITKTSKLNKIYLLVVSHVKSPTIWKPDSSSLFVRLLDVNMSVGDAHRNYVISKIAEIYCLLPLNIVMNLTKESIRKKWLKI